MRKAIVTKKYHGMNGNPPSITTTNVLVHGFNFSRCSVMVENDDGQLYEEPISSVKFLDKPEDVELTRIVTELVAGDFAHGTGGSSILIVQRAVKFAKEIILQTK